MDDECFKIVGVGGAGCKIADASAAHGDFTPLAVDSDAEALAALKNSEILCVGKNRFSGLGTNGDIASACMAAEEDEDAVAKVISGAKLLFIVVGLGGGAGGGMASVLAGKAVSASIPVVFFCVTPFSFEGTERGRNASKALSLIEKTGAVYAICPNDELCGLENSSSEPAFAAAMEKATDRIASGLSMLYRTIHSPGYIRLEPAGIIGALRGVGGRFSFATVLASGPDRARNAADDIGNILRTRLPDTQTAFVAISCGKDLMLSEIGDVMSSITSYLPAETEIKMGTVVDSEADAPLRVSVMLFKNRGGGTRPDSPFAGNGITVGDAAGSPAARRPVIPDRFAGTHSEIAENEQLDIPTYIRRGIHINII